MRISRIHIAQALQADTSITLDTRSSHYLSRVLRLQPGARVHLFNGDGHDYPACIRDISKQGVTVDIESAMALATESPLYTLLGLAISRGERMDYAIQKSTELGVSAIVPLFTANCEVKLQGERLARRLEHWRGVAISACEQCGRAVVPQIDTALSLEAFLSGALPDLKLLLDHEASGSLPTDRPAQGVALLIGPEGGLTPEEAGQARAAGFAGVRLGNRILRTETAPVAALSVIQYLWS